MTYTFVVYVFDMYTINNTYVTCQTRNNNSQCLMTLITDLFLILRSAAVKFGSNSCPWYEKVNNTELHDT